MWSEPTSGRSAYIPAAQRKALPAKLRARGFTVERIIYFGNGIGARDREKPLPSSGTSYACA